LLYVFRLAPHGAGLFRLIKAIMRFRRPKSIALAHAFGFLRTLLVSATIWRADKVL
jgi:hypothetical protein